MEKMTTQTLARLEFLLDTLVDGLFEDGGLTFEGAYACATLAREYIRRLNVSGHNDRLIDFYEMNPGFAPVMFTDAETVEMRIQELEALRNLLDNTDVPRHQFLMFPTSKAPTSLPARPNFNGRLTD